jgi:hypothetical protein
MCFVIMELFTEQREQANENEHLTECIYIHVIFSYYLFKVYINLIYVCKIKYIINYIGIVFAV